MSRQDGAVINRSIVHPDDMTCISHSLLAYLAQSLAAQTVPQAAEFCAESIYRTLVSPSCLCGRS
jgi:hypothetical protein